VEAAVEEAVNLVKSLIETILDKHRPGSTH
jgi:hypothetical protein